MKYNQPYGVADEVIWGEHPFVNGDPSIGRAGSIPPAEAIEYTQREIVNIIRSVATDLGITVSNLDLFQLGRAIQSGLMNGSDDTGTANAYATNMHIAPLGYTKYMFVILKIANTNTGPSVLNVNALGNKPIKNADGSDVSPSQLLAGSLVCFQYDGTNFQVVWANRVAGAPIFLTAAKVFYVNPATGSDSWDGTAATHGTGTAGPWASLQHAMNIIATYNLNGHDITVNCADGTGYRPFQLALVAGSGNVKWIGNPATPDNVLIDGNGTSTTCINGGNIGQAHIFDGFAVRTSGSYVGDTMLGVHVYGSGSKVELKSMSFGSCPGGHMAAEQGSTMIITGPERVTGGCAGSVGGNGAHIAASTSATIQTPATVACTVTTAVTFAGGWIQASFCSIVQILYTGGAVTGAGNVTGRRFTSSTNAVVSCNGGGLNYYPGTIAGSYEGTGDTGKYV
jgi:hypothetical protein